VTLSGRDLVWDLENATMGITEILGEKREEILQIAARHGATSDIDFLVDLEPGRSLFDLGGLLMDLQDLLGRKVDVVTEKSLHWYIRDKVRTEAKSM